MMLRSHVNYCTVCGWERATISHSRTEVVRQAIAHFRETGHAIESRKTEYVRRARRHLGTRYSRFRLGSAYIPRR